MRSSIWSAVFGLLIGVSALIAWRESRLAQDARLRLASVAPPADPTALRRQRDSLRSELATDAELAAWRSAAQAAAALEAEVSQRERSAEPPAAPVSKPPTRASRWTDRGALTPAAALESVLWAATQGEVTRLAGMLSLDPEARRMAETLFARLPEDTRAKYGSAEAVVALMIAGRMPMSYRSLSVLEQTTGSDGSMTVRTRLQRLNGSERTSNFRMRYAPGGWQLVVPPEVMAEFVRTLAGPAG